MTGTLDEAICELGKAIGGGDGPCRLPYDDARWLERRDGFFVRYGSHYWPAEGDGVSARKAARNRLTARRRH